MPSKRRLWFPYRLLVVEARRALGHPRGLSLRVRPPGREGIPSPPHGLIAVLYRLRSITRATRFACASTPFNDRPEQQFELGTDCLP